MDQAEQGAMAPAFPHTADWIGIVGGVFPFAFRYRDVSATNGMSVSDQDWVAIAGGTVALGAALFTIALLKRTPPELRSKRIASTAVLFVLGVFQLVLRGFLSI